MIWNRFLGIISGDLKSPSTHWLTRFVLLRWMGFVYAVAFLVAAQQLLALVGSHGLLPAHLFLDRVREDAGSTWNGFCVLPSVFWWNDSDAALMVVAWTGFGLSCVVVAGFANAIVMTMLWVLYMSIVHVGQDWYSYGWEIQILETGFLAIFLCPLLDMRVFPKRRTPVVIIYLFRWLIFRIMLGAGLIKLRGDRCWRDLTALYYYFETQPIPNALSRWFHFLPKILLKCGVLWNHFVELVVPWFAFWPRFSRHVAGILLLSLQFALILSGNLSFLNWLTIVPILACFDDSFWKQILPRWLVQCAQKAEEGAEECVWMNRLSWGVAVVIVALSINPVINLFSKNQVMNGSFERLHLVNTYGAFGTVGRERYAIIFEGTDSIVPDSQAVWKEYPFIGLPCDVMKTPPQIAPYQPHLDWQLWFAAMGTPSQYPWTFHLTWKLLHNDPLTLSLFAGNPFPDYPPRYVRAVLYVYRFAKPDDSSHTYWKREQLGLWLPALSVDDPNFIRILRQEGWINN
jgi:hypothetical protein